MSAYSDQPSVSHQTHWKSAATSRPVVYTNPSYKRSRDQVEEEPFDTIAPNYRGMEIEVEQEAIEYGEGMTIIDPSTGRTISAESQTGTWWEENLEIERQASIKAIESVSQPSTIPDRPKKSLRLDSVSLSSTSTSINSPEIVADRSQKRQSAALDTASLILGVGWKSIGQEEDTKAAAKGWAKFIENHFIGIGDICILLKSEAHQAYLVRANQNSNSSMGFFLFTENLSEGRLVAETWESCITNLKASPLIFQGLITLKAVRTPFGAHGNPFERPLEVDGLAETKSPESTSTSRHENMDID
ncbi:hypothetical protein MMC19_006353 [Ptychographa xylographoides]|nr:hypothetical protein [Ptychographa xylographoides]